MVMVGLTQQVMQDGMATVIPPIGCKQSIRMATVVTTTTALIVADRMLNLMNSLSTHNNGLMQTVMVGVTILVHRLVTSVLDYLVFQFMIAVAVWTVTAMVGLTPKTRQLRILKVGHTIEIRV
jgi:hypothetical protein